MPQTADPERNASGERRSARGGVLDGLLLCLLAVLDDVAVLEENPERDLAPERGTAQQELQIHAEVLELLPLGIAHDRPRLGVRLDRHALLVPADRLGLLGQRRAQPREGPGLAGQLRCGLVVLVETHGGIMPREWPTRHEGNPAAATREPDQRARPGYSRKMTRGPLGVIGVPTSAGAFSPGQEQAPAALRAAGLIGKLRDAGVDVRDHGDGELWRWRPDRENRRAQNSGRVAEIVHETAERVGDAIGAGEATMVLGGDCTVGIGTVAGHVASGESVAVVYFDTHADLNVPESVREGTLDWMGMAHMLAEDGAVRELVEVGARVPLLRPEQVLLFAWGPQQATRREREAIERLPIEVIPVAEVRADPSAAAARALDSFGVRADRLLVHFDVDVVDFTDTPLSENVGRNEGLAYDDAARALDVLLRSPRLAGLTITELNPAHVEEGAGSIERLTRDLVRGLSRRR